jgi:hypothetical protein
MGKTLSVALWEVQQTIPVKHLNPFRYTVCSEAPIYSSFESHLKCYTVFKNTLINYKPLLR